MAERSNAHDSKSCYAGMYTRVQIPFSAPLVNKTNPDDKLEFVLSLSKEFFAITFSVKK